MLILAIVVLGVVVWVIRRRLFTSNATSESAVWSLQHLRDLRAAGQISEGEFEVLKAQMLKSARSSRSGPAALRKDGAKGD